MEIISRPRPLLGSNTRSGLMLSSNTCIRVQRGPMQQAKPGASPRLAVIAATASPAAISPLFAAASVSFRSSSTNPVVALFQSLPLPIAIPAALLAAFVAHRLVRMVIDIVLGKTVMRALAPKIYLEPIDPAELRAGFERRERSRKGRNISAGSPTAPAMHPFATNEKMSAEEEELAADRLYAPGGLTAKDVAALKREMVDSANSPDVEEQLQAMADDKSRAKGARVANPFLKKSVQGMVQGLHGNNNKNNNASTTARK